MKAQRTHNQTTKVKRHHRGINISNGINTHTPSFNPSDDVLDHIFSFLPIKHAVRMGILSTRFQNAWHFNRNLYFGRDFARGRGRGEFIKIVSRVFDLHSGSKIQCFRLYIDPSGVEFIIQCWITKSVTKRVEELDLDFSQGIQPFNLSSDLLDVESIRVLKLSFCELNLPLKLKGLYFLKILVLRKVDVTENLIEPVFRNCMNLEVLDLAHCANLPLLKILAENLKRFKVLKVGDCSDIIWIDIDAPALFSFYYSGNVPNINFNSTTSHLKDVVLNFTPARGFMQHFHTRNLILNLARVRVLTINSTFLEGICPNLVDGELREMQFLWNLKEFQLFMESASYCNPYDIVSFLTHCPYLEKIFIDLDEFNFECGYYWELHVKRKFEQSRSLFNHLKLIKVKGFKFQNHELELVKFLLRRATFLETLALVIPRNCYTIFCAPGAKIYEQFFCSWRASPKAKIVICDHTDDRSFIYPKHSKIWY